MLLITHIHIQYSFPPSCVGEVGRIGAPSRREIGHGTLAERALEPSLPAEDDFPYTIRVESTITESNGSSRLVGLSVFMLPKHINCAIFVHFIVNNFENSFKNLFIF